MATQEEKISAIQHILKAEYNSTRWKTFLSELFTSSNFFSNPTQLLGINATVANQALHIGSINIIENGISRNIAVYEVTLADNVVLERNRVGLRNLLKPHWKQQDAAFIVYHHPQDKSWRFSYVSELKTFNEAGEYVDNKTEPKRYTYVLGENESCRTAAIQFSKLQDKASNATLDDIKEAFSVEKMSKEFFDTYKDHYQDFVQFLTGKRLEKIAGKWEEVVKHAPNTQLTTIFNNNEKDVRDFCKKLLGRIVFLYFIQKKGWLGVPLHDKWGNGKPDFISRLLANCRNPSIFYSEYLSKLFFETLNQPRPDDLAEIIPGEKTRVPYLNGGLFEEDNPSQRGLIFEAELFKDLFAFFDQYNFTIYEDDPNDHTVAVDPEMLGHIFENLLEDNKDKGAFYTPKEIVHYMCQESLIEYLTTWFEGKNYQVQQDTFISFDNAQQANFLSVNEGRTGQGVLEVAQPGQENSKVINRSLIEKLLKKQLSDEDKQAVIEHAAEFNEALDKVKICDPAIGSGAFPMGLLLEIFTAKQTIHTFTHGDLTSFEPAKVKLNIIQNSIYGVDIERGAVDIARLRFWLSLVVDEPEPQPLPNLDYKIVVGNSLISKLGDDVIEIDWSVKKNTTFDIFGEQETKSIQIILNQLTQLQKEFFDPSTRKKDHATKIRDLKIDLLNEQLSLMIQSKGVVTKPAGNSKAISAQTERYLQTEGWKQQISNLQLLKSKQDKTLEFFDWQLNFAEIMNNDVAGRNGFDIIIANPPYVDIKNLEPNFVKTLTSKFNTAVNRINLYAIFIEQSWKLLKPNGVISFIVPNSLLMNSSYQKVRELVVDHVHKIIKLPDDIFENAIVETIIFEAIKDKNDKNALVAYYKNDSKIDFENIEFQDISLKNWKLDSQFRFNIFCNDIGQQLLEKIDQSMEKCFSDKFDFSLGITPYDKYRGHSESLIKNKEFHSDFPIDETWVPLISGQSISRYVVHGQVSEYLKYGDWLGAPRKKYFFTRPRVIVRQIVSSNSTGIHAGYCDQKLFHTQIGFAIVEKENSELSVKLLCGLINSKLINFYHKYKFTDPEKNTFQKILIENAKKLPLPKINSQQGLFISNLTEKIIEKLNLGQSTSVDETILDGFIFRLFKLSYIDIKTIDPDFAISEVEYNAIKI
ncbi:MAG: N-6 DNA methylase [Methylotenera sp.]|nr:N-6 DNA methylase [Methylotenera sp.]